MPTADLFTAFAVAAARQPGAIAVVDPDRGSVTFGELEALATRIHGLLALRGVRPGDRVAIHVQKSIEGIAAILGVLRAGAVYIPVDPHGPVPRNAFIMHDCGVALAIVERTLQPLLAPELATIGADIPLELVELGRDGGGVSNMPGRDGPAPAPVARGADDLAYVLYTSGSTGRPKGVMLTHGNALSFVGWCAGVFAPTPADRFSSHAPFHFDLSILDLFLPLTRGSTLVLVSHEVGKDPARIAELVAAHALTVWYSAPSILTLLAAHGAPAPLAFPSLRLVLFAGEVFPVKHLRALQRRLPHPRYFNLYGPTETNVCTYHEIPPDIPEERTDPYPIGRTCENLMARVVAPDLGDTARGEEGELLISGPNVMVGYWGLEEQSARAFVSGPDGRRWYRTGDLVVEAPDGTFTFRGRRDRMVKKRGYRVELGEVEACVLTHPAVAEAAVVASATEDGVRITAVIASRDGGRISLIALKRHCAERVPLYMVPDQFLFVPALPRTSTDKTDYQRIQEMA
ncbi:MAG: amino acid adenylation domain-containing protein [Gemmatimonadetes bacterium]|nr:amino acid adenylation domain-containing protein [Gemmatimonadota bacterium]